MNSDIRADLSESTTNLSSTPRYSHQDVRPSRPLQIPALKKQSLSNQQPAGVLNS